MNYKYKIAGSLIIFKVRKTALNIFNGWVHNAHYYEGIDGEVLRKIDDEVIVKDFLETLTKAIESVSTKSHDKKDLAGWAYGYICGYIQGSLHTRWYAKYVVQQSQEYKNMLMLLSAFRAFESDQSAIDLACKFYQYYLLQDSVDMSGSIPSHIIDRHMKNVSLEQINKFNKDLPNFLKRESMKMMFNVFKNESDNYSPEVGEFLSQEEVEKLLADCEAM